MNRSPHPRLGLRRGIAGVTAAAILAGATVAVTAVSASAATAHHPSASSVIGPQALGVNTAAWDGLYTGSEAMTIDRELSAAHLGMLRYPGGSWADEYDWSTNTDTYACAGGPVTSACTAADSLDFANFSAQARQTEAASFVTVNYGSGTPAEAAGWVASARATKGEGVALWEVGNENYGCWETNDELAEYPTYVQGYTPNGSVCPTTPVMAKSYATNALPFLLAMKHADPSADIGVPWAFTATQAAGAGVTDAASWNDEVLGTDGSEAGFVDAHWYPFSSVSGLSDEDILSSVNRIPAAAASIRSELRRYDPRAQIVVGETNISNQETTLDFQPVAALFAAATSLEWLSRGVKSVDWWDMNNYGSPTGGDYGLFSSGSPETEPAGSPLPPYYGERLASLLTEPGSSIEVLHIGSPEVLGFASVRHGQRRILLVNTDPTSSIDVRDPGFRPGAPVQTSTYSASTSGDATPIVSGSARGGRSVELPAESIEVLSPSAS